MTKTDLIAQVAANTEMSKKSAELAVNAAFEALGKAMAEGEKITISGFGTFEVRERAERQGINPRTREPITIAASRSIVFKPGKALKDTLSVRFLPPGPQMVPAVFVTLSVRPVLSEKDEKACFGGSKSASRKREEGEIMRLDKYLKVSRLIKRRTVANEVADAGRILINGKIAKASQAVKEGDIIEVTFGNRPIKVKVLSDIEPRTKDVAREMYEIISE